MRRFTIWAAIAISVAMLSLAFLETGGRVPDQSPAAASTQPSHSHVETITATEPRSRVPLEIQEPPLAIPPCGTFDELVAWLVDLGLETQVALERGDRELAGQLNEDSRGFLQRLEFCYPRAEEHALQRVLDHPSEDLSPTATMQRRVLIVVIRRGFERRDQTAAAGDVRPLDNLVAAVLELLPADEGICQDLAPLLIVGSRLGLPHEELVLGLVTRAEAQAWLRGVAADLLLSLWHNLQTQGTRTTQELTTVALLFLDDTNVTRRRAAFRALLTLDGGRYRELALTEALQRGDRVIAEDLMGAATQQLPVREAVAILGRLAPLAGNAVMHNCVALGSRSPAAAARAYEELLATDAHPELRADLVSGISAQRDARSLGTAELAALQDPSPVVRHRALLALTGVAPRRGIELLETAATEDRGFVDRTGTEVLVLALGNLAQGATPGIAARVRAVVEILRRRDLSELAQRRLDKAMEQVANL